MSRALESLSVGGAQIAAFRMRRHHLDARASRGTLPAVVGDTCGVQAQVHAMAQIALWARLRDLTIDVVERALREKRTIVKTWSMRSTLHLHASRDLLMVLGGVMATRLRHHQRWIDRSGLKEEETTRMVLDALEGGPLTKRQLAGRLSPKLGAVTDTWRDGGWGAKKEGSSLSWYLVQPAMSRGLVCFGPSDGPEVKFVRIDQWLPESLRPPSELEAEDALFRRYLHSFGPADEKDFQAWSGNHLRRIRETVKRVRDDLVEVRADDHRGYLLRRDVSSLERAEADRRLVRLLPSFDPFLLGHRNRTHLLDQAHHKQVYKDQGWLAPVVLLEGRVAGTWSYDRGSRTLGVGVRMFSEFSKEIRAKAREEAEDLARFLEIPDVAVRFTR